jgi:membrane protein implicated in regulation of membrane protease activity
MEEKHKGALPFGLMVAAGLLQGTGVIPIWMGIIVYCIGGVWLVVAAMDLKF